jgi:hypothetical protein
MNANLVDHALPVVRSFPKALASAQKPSIAGIAIAAGAIFLSSTLAAIVALLVADALQDGAREVPPPEAAGSLRAGTDSPTLR